MSDRKEERILVLVNPVSGVRRRKLPGFVAMLEEGLAAKSYKIQLLVTRYAGHASRSVDEALRQGVRRFVVAGGDGTVNEVAARLAGTDAVLGIIPAGSGNGLAHHLEIPMNTAGAIRVINEGKLLRIDTCTVNGHFFASIAGIGFDARVARHFAKSNRRGFFTYARIVVKEYFGYTPRKYKLVLDGREHEARAFFISFANSSQFGYNTRIAPRASVTDGLIDVCVAKKPPIRAFPGIARLMLRKKIDQSRYMETYHAKEILVSRKRGKTVNVDGEPVRLAKRLQISIQPASLNIIVP
jgi:YegS/Rv2252/BmrU family lipid kinase